MRPDPRAKNGDKIKAPSEITPRLLRINRGLDGKPIELVQQVRKYELITPLFGGGVSPAASDPVTVIRGTEVRGHLRFWWRAMYGGKFDGDLRKMKAAEDGLWGAASTSKHPAPSLVQILVTVADSGAGQEKRPFEVVTEYKDGHPITRVREREETAPAYAAFPLRPEGNLSPNMPTKPVRTGVQFSLHILYPRNSGRRQYESEIASALWAWETFGGIGARTRRGFGSIRLLMVKHIDDNGSVVKTEDIAPPRVDGVEKYIMSRLPKALENKWHAQLPHLSNASRLVVTGAKHGMTNKESVIAVWKNLIEELKKFRQTRNGVRGRSKWPEPEKIRKLTGQRKPAHPPIPPNLDEFPRAVFGLPIVFHFKDSNKNDPDDTEADPRDTSLQFQDHDRFASPLILRPLICADNKAVGLAVLLLDEPEVIRVLDNPGMTLKAMKGTMLPCPKLKAGLDKTKAAKIVKSDGSELLGKGETSVLQAFLKRLK